MKKIIFGLALFIGSQGSAQTLPSFEMTPYLSQCGGKVYAKCDKAELDQQTIYSEALQLAKVTNRKLVIIAGADWCPACMNLELVMKSAPLNLKERFNKNFVLAKLRGDAASFKRLEKQKGWNVNGFPTMFVVDAETEKVKLNDVEADGSFDETLTKLEISVDRKNLTIAYPWIPKSDIGTLEKRNRVRVQLLQKPIALDPQVQKLVATDAQVSSKNPLAIQYYRQGLYYLFLYNWIDSVRSLRMAVEKDPQFLEAHLVLVEAFQGLESWEGMMGNIARAIEISKQGTYSKSALATLDLWKKSGCLENERYCEYFDIPYVKFDEKKIKEMKLKMDRSYQETADSDFKIIQNLSDMKEKQLVPLAQKFPNHVGIRHLLVHVYEGKDDYGSALAQAEILAKMAPKSAHAQHMLGHVLPKMNRWTDAITQFELAHLVHLEWMKENGATAEEDWHFRHNIDLLAHAYNFDRQTDNADKAWRYLCGNFGGRFCQSYISFLLGKNKIDEAASVLQKTQLDIPVDLALIKFLKSKMSSEDMQNLVQVLAQQKDDLHAELTVGVLTSKRGRDTKKIESQIEGTIKQAGFDSWSSAVLRAELYATLADRLDNKALAANIRLTIASVGFVCKATKK